MHMLYLCTLKALLCLAQPTVSKHWRQISKHWVS